MILGIGLGGGARVRGGLETAMAMMDDVLIAIDTHPSRGRDRGGTSRLTYEESVKVCRCGKEVGLVLEVVDVMRHGEREEDDTSTLRSIEGTLEWIDVRMKGVLERGRRFGGGIEGSVGSSLTGGSSQQRYCRKEVVVKYGVVAASEALERGLEVLRRGGRGRRREEEQGKEREVLDALGNVWRVLHGAGSGFGGVDGRRSFHVVVVDGGIQDRRGWMDGEDTRTTSSSSSSGLPAVGVVGGEDAIAVVDMGAGVEDSKVRDVVHEIDAWLYGERLGQLGSTSVMEACAVEARHHAEELLGLLDGGRHVRFDPESTVWRALIGAVEKARSVVANEKDVVAIAGALRRVLESPEFGVEARMPDMHVVALMLPLGLPLVLQFVSSLKFARKAK